MKLSIAQQNHLISQYLSGSTLTELSIIFKLAPLTLRKILVSNEILIRKKGTLRPKGRRNLDRDYFKFIDTPEKAYWAGFLMGDGCISKDSYKTTLISKDKEIIEKFKLAIKSDHKLSESDIYDKRTKKTYKRFAIQVASRDFTHHLINQGIDKDKSYGAKFPNISKELYSHFIRGLFDSDGSICFIKTGKRKINLIVSESISEVLFQIFKDEWNATTVKPSLVKEKDGRKIVKIHINRFDDQNYFLDYIYKDSTEAIQLSRKFILSHQAYSISRKGVKKDIAFSSLEA